MKLAVYGSKNQAQKARDLATSNGNIEVPYYIDNADFGRIGDIYDGAKVISIYKFLELYKKGYLQGVLFPLSYPKNLLRQMQHRIIRGG